MNPYQFIERVTGTIIGGGHKCARLYYDGRQQGGQLSGRTDADLIAGAWDGGDRISTNGPGRGNSVNVMLEKRGCAADTTDEEWEEIESSNYGVTVE